MSYSKKPTPSSSVDKAPHITIEFNEEETSFANYPSSKMMLKQDSFDTSVLGTRSEDIDRIQKTIGELASAFQNLAEIVSQQSAHVERIDYNIEECQVHVKASHLELLKYFRSVSSNRWLMFKLFFLLLIFVVMFIWIV